MKVNIILLFCLFFVNITIAQNLNYGVPFILLNSDAKSGGAGGVGISTTHSGNSVHYNMSKLIFADHKKNISAYYQPIWLSQYTNDAFFSAINFFSHLSEVDGFGVGVRYFTPGKVSLTDDLGQSLGDGRPNEFLITGGYSRLLGDFFSIGLSVNYLYSNLVNGNFNNNDIRPGHAFASDLSFTYEADIKESSLLRIGLVISKIGTKLKYSSLRSEYLPASIGLGLTYDTPISSSHYLSVTAEANKLMVPISSTIDFDRNGVNDYLEHSSMRAILTSFNDNSENDLSEMQELNFNLGLDFLLSNFLSIRGGVILDSQVLGGRKILTGGVGFLFGKFDLDFSINFPIGNYSSLNPSAGISITYSNNYYKD